MGWTGLFRAPGTTDREFFEKEFPIELTEKGEIIACGSVNFTFYAAVKNKDTGRVWALVVLMHRNRGYLNFSYKDMDEDMGPGYYECPRKVLDALTPTDHEYALQWREGCRAHHARRDAARRLKPGQHVKFASPMRFTNNTTYDTFAYVSRNTFRAADGVRVTISGWRDRTFEILTGAA